MSAPVPKAAPPPPAPLVIAAPVDGAEPEQVRVGWLRTIWRLSLEPSTHPWSAAWRLQRRGPLVALGAALALLLLFFLGCTPVPPQSLRTSAAAPQAPSGARCESLLVSREVQVPPSGEMADLRVTIEEIPPVLGKLRVLVRKPRFPAQLELDGVRAAAFDRVLELSPGAGQRELTVVLTRPPNAGGDWPRPYCKACRVDVELSGFYGAREGADAFFHAAMQEARAIDEAFARQSPEPPSRPSAALRDAAERLGGEARRCGVAADAPLSKVLDALERLDGARALFYAGQRPVLPDVQAVHLAFRAAAAALMEPRLLAERAIAAGWPGSLAVRSAGSLRASSQHFELMQQAAGLPRHDRDVAARWIALALAPDATALEQRVRQLPPIRDLDDARARLAWVEPAPAALVPIPGLSRPAALSVRAWHAVRRGKRCIGPGGAAPVRDEAAEARAVARLLGADDALHLSVARADEVTDSQQRARLGRALLCEPPRVDLQQAFAGLEDLGPASRRIEALLAELKRADDPRGELLREAYARAGELLCKLLAPENVQRRAATVQGYKLFVEGGTHLLELVPGPLRCESGDRLTGSEARRRLREAYRGALEAHAARDKLCPQRGGRCPDEIANSIRAIFSLRPPELARPAEHGRALDFPPPFGFGDRWVAKIDRCAREACDVLAQLQSRAPAGQFEGALCRARLPGDEQPQQVLIDRPEAPTSMSLGSCDAHVGVRLTLRRTPQAGTLVAIASPQRFRYGSQVVGRQSRHPQLGRIFERVTDLDDPSDAARRPDGAWDVALTPSVENQVFYFFSLRRRDY